MMKGSRQIPAHESLFQGGWDGNLVLFFSVLLHLRHQRIAAETTYYHCATGKHYRSNQTNRSLVRFGQHEVKAGEEGQCDGSPALRDFSDADEHDQKGFSPARIACGIPFMPLYHEAVVPSALERIMHLLSALVDSRNGVFLFRYKELDVRFCSDVKTHHPALNRQFEPLQTYDLNFKVDFCESPRSIIVHVQNVRCDPRRSCPSGPAPAREVRPALWVLDSVVHPPQGCRMTPQRQTIPKPSERAFS